MTAFIYDVLLLFMLTMVLLLAARGRGREAAVLFFYAAGAAYLLHHYFGFQSALFGQLYNAADKLAAEWAQVAVSRPEEWTGGGVRLPDLFDRPFGNDVVDALYLIGMGIYTAFLALVLVFTNAVVRIAQFISSLIRRR